MTQTTTDLILSPYLLLYRADGAHPLSRPEVFFCQADSQDHAEEQLESFLAGAMPLWHGIKLGGESNRAAYQRVLADYFGEGEAQYRARYWKQRARSTEGRLSSDLRLAGQAIHTISALKDTPWDQLTDVQRFGFERAAGLAIHAVNEARGARLPHDVRLERAGEDPAEVKRQRDLLVQAIGEAALSSGIYRGDIAGLSGPQLLMACSDLAQAVKAAADDATGPAVANALRAILDGELVLTRDTDATQARQALTEYDASRGHDPEACPCGVETFVEPWEPGCGLGISEEHVVVATPAPANCTCPSGDGSLGWPCPSHPPEQAQRQDAVVDEEASFDAWIASTGLRVDPNVRECMRSAWNVRAALSAQVAPTETRQEGVHSQSAS